MDHQAKEEGRECKSKGEIGLAQCSVERLCECGGVRDRHAPRFSSSISRPGIISFASLTIAMTPFYRRCLQAFILDLTKAAAEIQGNLASQGTHL